MKLQTVATSLFTVFVLAGSAAAEPIQIVDRAFVFERGSLITVNLTGDAEGFSYSGTVHPGLIGSFLPLLGDPVPPGSLLSLETTIGGTTIGGTATFRGETHVVGSQDPTSTHIDMEWTGSLALPADFMGGSLTTPFAFTGNFAFPGPPNNALTDIPLVGSGLASLTFGTHSSPGFLILNAVRFDFEAPATPEPIPEPASMLLIGSGLAGLAAARRRRISARN